ncbi:MAG TPA: GAF domain-containing protein [Gaiellaceae bacterium]|nr:GAF domain-containing protein [Gaiellaceae bacterium]
MNAELRLADVLAELAEILCREVQADACAISRAVGDVLIVIAEHAPGRSVEVGQAFLVHDYPAAREVMSKRAPLQLSIADPATILRQLGFGALLMLPVEVSGEVWGLVEVYRREPDLFAEDLVLAARKLVAATAARIP